MDNQEMYPAIQVQAETSLAQIEQSRAVAEVQASIVLAKANPRNEEQALMKIMNACKRKSLAEHSSYSFKRGTSLISGPNIRLLEVIARYWQNLNFGFREVGRGDGFSEVEAFAHDLETNTRVTRQFQVRHWRDTKSGGYAIKEERDKYELVANMAQRRVRACLIGVIPADVVESADAACKATLEQSVGDVNEAVENIIMAFKKFEVTPEMIETHLQRKLKSIVPADIVNLRRIYNSIRDGIAEADEFFKQDDASELEKKILESTKPKLICAYCGWDKATSERGLKKHVTQQHPGTPKKGGDKEPPVTMITPEQTEKLFSFLPPAQVAEICMWNYGKELSELTSFDAGSFIARFDDIYNEFKTKEVQDEGS